MTRVVVLVAIASLIWVPIGVWIGLRLGERQLHAMHAVTATEIAASIARTNRSFRFGQAREAPTETDTARRSLRAGKTMAHLACRRRGERASVSTKDDQATIPDNGFFRQLLSLNIQFRTLAYHPGQAAAATLPRIGGTGVTGRSRLRNDGGRQDGGLVSSSSERAGTAAETRCQTQIGGSVDMCRSFMGNARRRLA